MRPLRETLLSRHELAWAIASQDRGHEAEIILRAVIDIRTRVLRPDHPRTLQSHHELAWAIAMQGRHREAIAQYQTVLAARERTLGPDHHDTVATRQALDRLRGGKTTPAHHLA